MRKCLFICLVAVVGLIGCSRNQEIDVPDANLSIFARTESPADTKTVVESGVHVYWEPGDEIAVFTGEQSAKFTTDITAASGTAIFKGTFGDATWPEDLDLWAVYPFSEDAVFDGETITTTLPSEQVAREGSFGKDMNLAIAHSTGTTLQFYNVGGGIRFSVTEEGIKKVMFEGLSGEIISGKVKIGMDENGKPEVKEVTGGSQFITLLPPTGKETFEPGAWYFIVAIPGSLEGGYKLRFYKDSDYARKVSDKAVEIKRSIFGSLEKADEEIEYEATTTHFPVTKEEIKASIALTHSIGNKVTSIIDYQDESVDDQSLGQALEEIEGVTNAIVDSEEGVCSIMQKDSVWINYLIYSDNVTGDTQFFSNDDLPVNPEQAISDRRNALKISGSDYGYDYWNNPDKTFNNRGKALIMIPFYYSRRELNIPFLTVCLEEAGFSKSNIDVRINSLSHDEDSMLSSWNYAFITEFQGDNLSKYDFILIYTHGGTGYRAKSPKGIYVDKQSSLCSGTEYNEGTVERYINSGTFSWEDIAIFGVDAGKDESGNTIVEYYLAMTPRFLEDAQFNNSCVILSACSSAAILDNSNNGSMVKTFLDKGAGIVHGFSRSVSADYLNIPMTKHIIEFSSLGLSIQDAVQLYKDSPISKLRYLSTMDKWKVDYKDFGWKKRELKYKIGGLDPEISYLELKESLSGKYYLTDPFPHLNPVDLTSYPGSILFTWECNLKPFRDVINYSENPNGEPEYTRYSVQYDIHVVGPQSEITLHSYNTEKKALWESTSMGDYSWSIIAKIMEGDSILASYQSAEGHFTISDGNLDDIPGHNI